MSTVNNNYWYDDSDLQAILVSRTTELFNAVNFDVPNVQFMAAVSSKEEATNFLFPSFSVSEARAYFVYPILISNHWVGAVCTSNGTGRSITLLDSAMSESHKIELQAMLENEFNVKLVFSDCRQQPDGSSCGAFLVENVLSHIIGESCSSFPWRDLPAHDIRKVHLDTLKANNVAFSVGFLAKNTSCCNPAALVSSKLGKCPPTAIVERARNGEAFLSNETILSFQNLSIDKNSTLEVFNLVSQSISMSKSKSDLRCFIKTSVELGEVNVFYDAGILGVPCVEGTLVFEVNQNLKGNRKNGWIKPLGSDTLQSPSEFIRTKSDPYTKIQIRLKDKTVVSLEAHLGSLRDKKNCDTTGAKQFNSLTHHAVYDKLKAVQFVPRVAFRVCRSDEVITQCISPRINCDVNNLRAYEYFSKMGDHLARSNTNQPFCSATSLLRCALWWSSFGVQRVVAIYPQRLLETIKQKEDAKKVCVWNFAAETLRNSVLPEGGFQHQRSFARRSFEVIFDGPIPMYLPLSSKESGMPNYEQVHCSWTIMNRWDSDNSRELVDLPQLGTPFNPRDFFKDVTALAGSSFPVKVMIQSDAPKFLVIKRGTGSSVSDLDPLYGSSRFSAGNRHAVNEFISNCMYKSYGVPVPCAQLLDVVVETSWSTPKLETHTRVFVLLFEFLSGGALNIEDKDSHVASARKHLHIDMLFDNFDVCGDKGQNLLMASSNNQAGIIAYRIDVGGCLCFSATGARRDPGQKNFINFLMPKKDSTNIKDPRLILAGCSNARQMDIFLNPVRGLHLPTRRNDLACFPEWHDACNYVTTNFMYITNNSIVPNSEPSTACHLLFSFEMDGDLSLQFLNQECMEKNISYIPKKGNNFVILTRNEVKVSLFAAALDDFSSYEVVCLLLECDISFKFFYLEGLGYFIWFPEVKGWRSEHIRASSTLWETAKNYAHRTKVSAGLRNRIISYTSFVTPTLLDFIDILDSIGKSML
jgi:hypothetical protein